MAVTAKRSIPLAALLANSLFLDVGTAATAPVVAAKSAPVATAAAATSVAATAVAAKTDFASPYTAADIVVQTAPSVLQNPVVAAPAAALVDAPNAVLSLAAVGQLILSLTLPLPKLALGLPLSEVAGTAAAVLRVPVAVIAAGLTAAPVFSLAVPLDELLAPRLLAAPLAQPQALLAG